MTALTTTVKHCNCSHKFQDKRYGKGQRVFNAMGKSSSGGLGHSSSDKGRCTVCGLES